MDGWTNGQTDMITIPLGHSRLQILRITAADHSCRIFNSQGIRLLYTFYLYVVDFVHATLQSKLYMEAWAS